MLKAILPIIGLFLLPALTHAGQVQQINFEGNRLTIQHSGCQFHSPLQETIKLIIPLENCISLPASEMFPTHQTVKKIHWAQHDKNTVWLVFTLKPNYQFNIHKQINQLEICFPECQQSLSWHTQSVQQQIILFELANIQFHIPLQDMSIEQFFDKSIGFLPKDVIRDGLPHFGSKRGDWLGKPRKHRGYDIYTDNINVLAMADAEVIAAKAGKLSGLYVKLKHDKNIYTVYVHLTSVSVNEGDKVKQGQIIGRVDGAAGNAVQPQLHIELKPNDKSIDPLPLIELYYQGDLQVSQKIQAYKQKLPALIQYREQLLQQYLQNHRSLKN